MLFIIEDEPDIRDSIREILESEGYEVHAANNGLEAQTSLRLLPTPDLILLDALMPKMNGKEFRDWQLTQPRLSHVPVIVLSATAFSKPMDGEVSHLQKPVDLNELLGAVKAAIA